MNNAWQAASQEIYAATGGKQPGGDGATQEEQPKSDEGSEDVSDVEYEEVDDKDKKK